MSMKSLILAAALAGLPAAAHAQNAEEAVAYAFFGLADGANLVRGTTTMLWKEAAVSPATFESAAIVKGSPVPLRFTVKSVGECTFEVTVEGPPNVIPGKKRLFAKVDLRRITGVTVAEGARTSTISGSGFCETGMSNPTCMEVTAADLFGPIDQDRHKAALAFLKNEACRATE